MPYNSPRKPQGIASWRKSTHTPARQVAYLEWVHCWHFFIGENWKVKLLNQKVPLPPFSIGILDSTFSTLLPWGRGMKLTPLPTALKYDSVSTETNLGAVLMLDMDTWSLFILNLFSYLDLLGNTTWFVLFIYFFSFGILCGFYC